MSNPADNGICLTKNKKQIWAKMNSFRNRYNNNEDFIADINSWPRTVKKLIFSSTKLMIHFGLVELIPDPEETFIGME